MPVDLWRYTRIVRIRTQTFGPEQRLCVYAYRPLALNRDCAYTDTGLRPGTEIVRICPQAFGPEQRLCVYARRPSALNKFCAEMDTYTDINTIFVLKYNLP